GAVQAGAQPCRHFLEQQVSSLVAGAVVDVLELIEIDVEQRGSLRQSQPLEQLLMEVFAIDEAGEPVDLRLMLQGAVLVAQAARHPVEILAEVGELVSRPDTHLYVEVAGLELAGGGGQRLERSEVPA